MSTPNFYSKSGKLNGSNTVYAVPHPIDEDIKSYCEDNELVFDNLTEDDKESIYNMLQEQYCEDAQENSFYELKENKKFYVNKANDSDDDLRSYPGHVFAELEKNKTHEVFKVEAKLIIRGGYYAYANLDFDYQVYSAYSGDYYDVDDLDEGLIAEELQYYYDRKPAQRQVSAVLRNLQNDIQEIDEAIRKVYADYTHPLARLGVFSNGEAVYESIGAEV